MPAENLEGRTRGVLTLIACYHGCMPDVSDDAQSQKNVPSTVSDPSVFAPVAPSIMSQYDPLNPVGAGAGTKVGEMSGSAQSGEFLDEFDLDELFGSLETSSEDAQEPKPQQSPKPETVAEPKPIAEPEPSATGTLESVEQVVPELSSGGSLEFESSSELPPEVESYIEEIQSGDLSAPPQVVKQDPQSGELSIESFPNEPIIVLPISEEVMSTAKKASPKSSLRWLYEYCVRIIKRARLMTKG